MRKISFVLVIVLLLGLIGTTAFAKTSETGNGAPSGAHFTLNIIGTTEKNMDEEKSGGHVIFALYNKSSGKTSTRILLRQGEDFAVLDKDGTDGEAKFQLPNDLYYLANEETIISKYAVYVRALGKPGEGTLTSGFIDEYGHEWLSVGSVTLKKTAGQPPKFINATKDLFSVEVDMDSDGATEIYPLFSDALAEYFWDLDGTLRHVQMRFYEETTIIK